MNLGGKVVLVTGAARRIGRALAEDLAAAGAQIAVHYRTSREDAFAAVDAINAAGGEAEAFAADLARAPEVSALVRQVCARFGGLDVVIASHGCMKKTPWEKLDERAWDFHFDGNLKSVFLLAHAASRHLREGGAFITIADAAADRPGRDYLPYLVSKAGVIALTRHLAIELSPLIFVGCVAPELVLPPDGASEDLIMRLAATTPGGRWGTPADVTAAVRRLLAGELPRGTVLKT